MCSGHQKNSRDMASEVYFCCWHCLVYSHPLSYVHLSPETTVFLLLQYSLILSVLYFWNAISKDSLFLNLRCKKKSLKIHLEGVIRALPSALFALTSVGVACLPTGPDVPTPQTYSLYLYLLICVKCVCNCICKVSDFCG